MIYTKDDLKEFLVYEKSIYLGEEYNIFLGIITNSIKYKIWRFVFWLRHCEYHKNNKGIWHKLALLICRRYKNKIGIALNIEIYENCFGKGLHIYHSGVIVNSQVRCGNNVALHGLNVIGNKGAGYSETPIIGNDVELGCGAHVLGRVVIADNCKIGANAVCINDFRENNSIIVGIPAKKVNK